MTWASMTQRLTCSQQHSHYEVEHRKPLEAITLALYTTEVITGQERQSRRISRSRDFSSTKRSSQIRTVCWRKCVRCSVSRICAHTEGKKKTPATHFNSLASAAKVLFLGCTCLISVWLPSRPPLCVHPAQGVSTARVEDILMQEDVGFGRVAVDVEEPEAGPFQLLQQTVPVPNHGRVIAGHFETRPVQVKLQQQLTHRVQNSLQKQVLQNLPLCALHICLKYIHLEQRRRMTFFYFFLR